MARLPREGSPAFEEWSLLVREDLHRKVVSALSFLAQACEQRDEYDQACAYAVQLVALEPWHEETCRQLMRLLALDGQRTAAFFNDAELLVNPLACDPPAGFETCGRVYVVFFQLASGYLGWELWNCLLVRGRG